MRVRPTTPGTIVRDPHTKRPLPDEGAEVADSSYWHRRLRSGDITLVEGGPVPPEDASTAPLATRSPGETTPPMFEEREVTPEHAPVGPLATRSTSPMGRR